MGRTVTVVLSIILVSSLPIAVVSGISTVDTDPQNELDHEETIGRYNGFGVASADIGSVEVTIARDSDDIGYDGFVIDSTSDFLKVNHTHTDSEEAEFYVPNDYFLPRPHNGLPALDGGPSADLERVTIDGDYYTKVTIEFEEVNEVIYPIDRVTGGFFSLRTDAKEVLYNSTSITEPTNEEIWRQVSIPEEEVSNGNTIVDATVGDTNQTDIIVVYEPNRSLLFGEKLQVPECGGKADIDNVCIEDKRGGVAQVLFKNVDTEDPEIMYKHELGFIDRTALSINDIGQIPERVSIPFQGDDE